MTAPPTHRPATGRDDHEPPGGEEGFTLLELIVSLSILTIVLLALSAALTNSMSLDALTRERTIAVNAAMSEMEEVLAEAGTSWTTFALRTTTADATFPVTVDMGSSTASLPAGSGLTDPGSVTVTATGKDDFYKVEVKVTWKSTIGKDVEVSLQSLVTKQR